MVRSIRGGCQKRKTLEKGGNDQREGKKNWLQVKRGKGCRSEPRRSRCFPVFFAEDAAGDRRHGPDLGRNEMLVPEDCAPSLTDAPGSCSPRAPRCGGRESPDVRRRTGPGDVVPIAARCRWGPDCCALVRARAAEPKKE